jgi:hypothetical protein
VQERGGVKRRGYCTKGREAVEKRKWTDDDGINRINILFEK